MKKKILLVNDDGIYAGGLQILAESLRKKYNVFIVAPLQQQSGKSFSMTLGKELTYKELDAQTFAVQGTPLDCVNLGVNLLVKEKPDMIVSGINLGVNLGRDVFYSGTVSAAYCGYLMGIRSLANSAFLSRDVRNDYLDAVKNSLKIIDYILENESSSCLYNLNTPRNFNGKFKFCRVDDKIISPKICKERQPEGRETYWTEVTSVLKNPQKDSDCYYFSQGYSTLSPLCFNTFNKEEFDKNKILFDGNHEE